MILEFVKTVKILKQLEETDDKDWSQVKPGDIIEIKLPIKSYHPRDYGVYPEVCVVNTDTKWYDSVSNIGHHLGWKFEAEEI